MIGKITVGSGSEQREIEISDFVQSTFKNNRIVSVCGLEDGSMVLGVENPPSSGRATQVAIWLSKESVLGLISTCFIYFSQKGEDVEELFTNSIQNDDLIDFVYSDNLQVGYG